MRISKLKEYVLISITMKQSLSFSLKANLDSEKFSYDALTSADKKGLGATNFI